MEAKTDYDYLFKILLIGDSGVGKSSILIRYTDNTYSTNYITTIGVDFKIMTLRMNGYTIKLQIWDTAGQERFRTITKSYYRGAHGIMLVYDVTNNNTFAHIDSWMTDVLLHSGTNAKVLLIGNKIDSPLRVVDSYIGENYASDNDMIFVETSAKSGDNIRDAFRLLTEKLLNEKIDTKTDDVVNIVVPTGKPINKRCCNQS